MEEMSSRDPRITQFSSRADCKGGLRSEFSSLVPLL